MSSYNEHSITLALFRFEERDTKYVIAVLIMLAIIHSVYGSPILQDLANVQTTKCGRAIYRWVDFLIKSMLIFSIGYAATQDTFVSITIALVFILFMINNAVIIETKNVDEY